MIYVFDDDKILTDVIPDKTAVTDAAHETLIAPEEGLYEPWVFDTTAQKWTGATKADFEKERPAAVPNTTSQALAAVSYQLMTVQQTTSDLQQASAQTAYQMMQGQQTITDLQTANAQLAYQVMTNGGNA